MRPNRTVLIVGGKLKIVAKARALGLGIVYFQQRADYSEAHARLVDNAFLFDYQNEEMSASLAATVSQYIPITAVVSFTELGLLSAARINDRLGLNSNSHAAVGLLKDKWEMRTLLNAHGLGPVRAAAGDSLEQLREFVAGMDRPVIVKPLRGTASVNVVRVDGLHDVEAAWQRFAGPDHRDFIAEEFLEGPELSVEAFSFHGHHVTIAVTEKEVLPGSFVEMGHALPARLEPERRAEVTDCVTRFLDLVGIREGPTHTEVKITADGVRVIESHNRIGGDKINELVELAYGIDMDTLTLQWLTDSVAPLQDVPQARQGAAVRFFRPPPGKLEAVLGSDDAGSMPGVVDLEITAAAGSLLADPTSSFERVGYVLAGGHDVEAAIARCERAREAVRFRVEEECRVLSAFE